MTRMMLLLSSLVWCSHALAAGFTLTSKDISGQLADAQVFNSFGCTGQNVSPELRWHDAPSGTKSFAVTMYDPDAPTGSGWWHWVVFNIPAGVNHLAAGASMKAMPKGAVESETSYGSKGFGGACPPPGDKPHRYIVTVYALDVARIEQSADARPELIGFFLNRHALAKASVMAYYGR